MPSGIQAHTHGDGGHEYRDFSHITSIDDPAILAILPAAGKEWETTSANRNFPAQLHFVLSELEADGMSDICGYQPHGRCFVVRKPKEFVEQILCRYVTCIVVHW
jgi:hypothetical protein